MKNTLVDYICYVNSSLASNSFSMPHYPTYVNLTRCFRTGTPGFFYRVTAFRKQEFELLGNDFAQAASLGIEALKEVKKARYGDPALDGELLPGETED